MCRDSMCRDSMCHDSMTRQALSINPLMTANRFCILLTILAFGRTSASRFFRFSTKNPNVMDSFVRYDYYTYKSRPD